MNAVFRPLFLGSRHMEGSISGNIVVLTSAQVAAMLSWWLVTPACMAPGRLSENADEIRKYCHVCTYNFVFAFAFATTSVGSFHFN